MENANWIVRFLGREYEAHVHDETVNIGGKIYQKSHPKLELIRPIDGSPDEPVETSDDYEMKSDQKSEAQKEESNDDNAGSDLEKSSE